MNAKETVMTGEQMSEAIQRKTKEWSICNPAFIEDVAGIIAQAQAEVSFPLGEKQGVRKVVEWVRRQDVAHDPDGGIIEILILGEDWQSFLKENGLEMK